MKKLTEWAVSIGQRFSVLLISKEPSITGVLLKTQCIDDWLKAETYHRDITVPDGPDFQPIFGSDKDEFSIIFYQAQPTVSVSDIYPPTLGGHQIVKLSFRAAFGILEDEKKIIIMKKDNEETMSAVVLVNCLLLWWNLWP